MWIPRPIYEALPVLYAGIGVTMIALLVYLAESSLPAILYGAVAVACLVAGAAVHRARVVVRQKSKEPLQSNGGDVSPEPDKL